MLCPVAQHKVLGIRMLEAVSRVTAGRDGSACPVPLLSRRGDAGQFVFALPGRAEVLGLVGALQMRVGLLCLWYWGGGFGA